MTVAIFQWMKNGMFKMEINFSFSLVLFFSRYVIDMYMLTLSTFFYGEMEPLRLHCL